MVTSLYRQSSPVQKAGLINQVLAAVGAAGVVRALPMGWIRALPGVLRGAGVTPEQATKVRPEEVELLVANAASQNPRMPEKTADFYARHPALAKAIGARALALVMWSISRAEK